MIDDRRSLALRSAAAVLAAAACTSTLLADAEALEFAFRFGSAIVTDANDRAHAQQAVVTDYVKIGLHDDALAAAGRMGGWRQAVALADIAAALARAGRPDDARTLVRRVEAMQPAFTDWTGPRVSAHLAAALAALGEAERATELADRLASADPLQYAGRSAATVAAAHAARGEFDRALQRLADATDDADVVVSLDRAEAYVELSGLGRSTAAERHQALEAARAAADQLAGWQRAEILERTVAGFSQLGDAAAARSALAALERFADETPARSSIRATVLTFQALAVARTGDAARSRKLLAEAEAAVPNAERIDRPGVLAFVASGHFRLDDPVTAWRVVDRALAEAAALVNSRPRALAAVQICRSLGQHRIPLTDAVRGRLEGLLSGLGAPW